jgi:hypothetical protein
MLQCFEDLKYFLAFANVEEQMSDGQLKRIFYLSKAQKRSIRLRLAAPKGLEKWASVFHVDRKSIMKRILEIEQETPGVRKMIVLVKRF